MLGGALDPLAEASLDSFVDLSTYLMGDPFESKVDVTAVEDEPAAEGTSSMKRSLDEMEHVDVVDMEEEVVTTAPDHDYVTKCPRLSCSSETSNAGVSSTPHVCTEQKYRERRKKNNVASRRSREIRKQKFNEMDEQAERLIVENENLRKKITDLEKLAKEMKAILVSRLAGK